MTSRNVDCVRGKVCLRVWNNASLCWEGALVCAVGRKRKRHGRRRRNICNALLFTPATLDLLGAML